MLHIKYCLNKIYTKGNKMKNIKNLCKNRSGKLLDSLNLLNTLKDITDGEAKETTLLTIIQNNIKSTFDESEQCRKMIYISD